MPAGFGNFISFPTVVTNDLIRVLPRQEAQICLILKHRGDDWEGCEVGGRLSRGEEAGDAVWVAG